MAVPDSSSPPRSTRPLWLAVAALLAVGIVLPLLVWIYDRETPALFGFPFYYWFQFLLVPVAATLTFIAFRLSLTATSRDRAARGQSYRAGEGPGERR
jgi:hypothetical protein